MRKIRAGESTFLAIALVVAALTGLLAAALLAVSWAAPGRAQPLGDLPTLFAIPTATATLPGPTVNATWTASPTITQTPSITPSRVPTLTGTATATRTLVPSDTPRPSATPTLTATLTPTRTPTLTPTATLPPTLTATNSPTPGFTPTHTPTPAPTPVLASSCPPREGAASACAGAAIIRTVDYQRALVESPGLPYPTVDFARLGGITPAAYDTLLLENDSLRLTFLPALGGRLYQIYDKATGQNVLYNNPVITPTHWGPPGMQWWLEVGGVEWAFPVEEHGYAWGLPWTAAAVENGDGSASITLSFYEQVKQLDVHVAVSLPATGRAFTVATALENKGEASAAIQYWNNAALLAGPGMRADLPTGTVEVHGAGLGEGVRAGQVIGWNSGMTEWGAWREWFSGFAWEVSAGSVRMRGAGTQAGLLRLFNPAITPGIKFFTFGPYSTVPNEYYGLPVFEVWGGVTADFNTTLALPPGERLVWSEVWTVIDW